MRNSESMLTNNLPLNIMDLPLNITDLPLNIMVLPLNIMDLPVEILCRIFNYSDTPLNYTNISLVCRLFYNANKMLINTKAIQFLTLYKRCKRKYDKVVTFQEDMQFYSKLPNGTLHGKHFACLFYTNLYSGVCSFPNEIQCDIYEWGGLVRSIKIKSCYARIVIEKLLEIWKDK
jgi:hypothetical protein